MANRTMTNYDVMMEEMTVEQLAMKNVQLVIINNTEPFYMTTTGQLFPFNSRKDAIEFEKRFLTMEAPNPAQPDTEGVEE